MPEIIAVSVLKGGTGKTSTANALAWGLFDRGNRVLVIDIDSQKNQNISFNYFGKPDYTLYDAILAVSNEEKPKNPAEYIFSFGNQSPHLMPATEDFSKIDRIAAIPGAYDFLKDVLEPIYDLYDYIIIDCPPSLSYLPLAALTASNWVVIPVTLESLPVRGVNDFIQRVSKTVVKRLNKDLRVLGVLVTMTNTRPILSRGLLEELKKQLEGLVFDTMIRKNIAISEAQHLGESIYKYSPDSAGAEDYNKFTDEVLTRIRDYHE